ncbi:MAG: DUF5103 domain-containing protein [Muribaculaceae bacterium]|nr:DUF5103 domain-containing protein [Muribaculaceae bacterium]
MKFIRIIPRLAVFAALSLLTAGYAAAQDMRPHIFSSSVKSLKLSLEHNPYAPPILILGGEERLNVNFDYLDYDVHYLRYSVVHCNADWTESVLMESEYVDGFNYADIDDYEQSVTTFTHYYNYNFTLPNDNFRITKSGNYLLKVYEQDDPDKILFQTRFVVCENSVSVRAAVTSRTDFDYNSEHQQVSFEVIGKTRGQIRDPYGELTAVVTQNSRTDNQVVVTRPMMVAGDVVTFDHNQALIFDAGNEFRRMEMVSVHSINMGVEKMQYFEPFYHASLFVDRPRANTQYLYDQTQFGRFTIRNRECDNADSNTCADYVVAHFTLDTDGRMFTGGRIYLQGEFTQAIPQDWALMKWDSSQGLYVCDLLLKQGAYNYQYLWVPDGTTMGRAGMIEGNKFQTINEYLVRIYDRPMGERYDHLVGFAVVYSGR